MKTEVDVDGLDGLVQHLRSRELIGAGDITVQRLAFTPNGGDDDRIGYKDVHLVTLDGYGPVGYCEGQPAVTDAGNPPSRSQMRREAATIGDEAPRLGAKTGRGT